MATHLPALFAATQHRDRRAPGSKTAAAWVGLKDPKLQQMRCKGHILGKSTMILTPKFLGHFGRVPLLKHIFGVTLAEVAIIVLPQL